MKKLILILLLFSSSGLALNPVKIIEKGKIVDKNSSGHVVFYHVIYKNNYYVCVGQPNKIYCDKAKQEQVE